eukprot:575913-Pyramimonas_sp.AAC.1
MVTQVRWDGRQWAAIRTTFKVVGLRPSEQSSRFGAVVSTQDSKECWSENTATHVDAGVHV